MKTYGRCPICGHEVKVPANLREKDIIFRDTQNRVFHLYCIRCIAGRITDEEWQQKYYDLKLHYEDMKDDTQECALDRAIQ